ncbi:uncharacterized protein at4g19900 [Phtheirospermum japonicum]|uniref:Uncharacterized protein at4g19900 n=1 Tax=Phtheirospermum japonicum TaxID=374723 RepID=A0A830CZN2_9LAMI|nr:uncharacterized protein at4g19900 [Phtheirospermum japonicum]
MKNITTFLSQLLLYWKRSKRSFYTLIPLVLLCLLAYNTFTIFFCTNLPSFPAKNPPEPLPPPSQNSTKQRFHISRKNQISTMPTNITAIYRPKRRTRQSQRRALEILSSSKDVAKRFEARVEKFFRASSKCESRFFMTWISSVESFGEREMFSMESLFKAHPNGCLIIVSRSMDSRNGLRILRPFLKKGFKVTAISPDFNYLFKKTEAQAWYNRLKHGDINPGLISLGQNLSNLLRIGLLYRFGGIYLDTDIIVLKSFSELKNVIGAQTVDQVTGKWSRLNNAVMIFDKGHPLLLEFINEFAKTFNGNKWGHNGPYLVSRVVSRVSGNIMNTGYNFTVLPPMAFYPVGWRRIGSLFEGPKSLSHSKWLVAKIRQIRRQSFGVHLWNKQSRKFKVEKGSVIQHILFSSCVFKNCSS